jgi:hypothetical protein
MEHRCESLHLPGRGFIKRYRASRELLAAGQGRGAAGLPPFAQPIEIEVNDRRGVKREHLAEYQATLTVNICGRCYILRAEIARFNQRPAAGEFAKSPNRPRKSTVKARI